MTFKYLIKVNDSIICDFDILRNKAKKKKKKRFTIELDIIF